jgi:hypothetical protein
MAAQLAVLPEAAMRAASLHGRLQTMSADDAAWMLDGLATAGRAGGAPFDLALIAAVDLCGSERFSYEERRSIFMSAERLGLEACRELLYSSSTEAEQQEAAARPRALIPGTRPLTLGERKALARSWDRSKLEQLLHDPHEDVIALLIANPRVTEDDILRLATARRATACALQLIMDAPRWKARPRVRRALLRNPRMAEASALRLVGLLNRAELMEIKNDLQLSARIIHAIRRRLAPKM